MSRFPESLPRAGKPRKERLAPFPAALRPSWHTPSDACSRRDPDSLADAWVQQCPSHFFFCFLISLSQVLLSHQVKAVLQKPVPNCVCPSQWHTPNCQLTGGHTTWGTVIFPHQMEFYWSRRRPTTGLLEQMLCRQSLDLSFPHPPLVPPSLTACVDVSRAL